MSRSLLEIGVAHRVVIAILLGLAVWGGVLWVLD